MRNENLDKIKLQIVADNDVEVQEMQQKIDEQMQLEKEAVEARMKHRREEVIEDKKRKLESRITEM